MQHISKAYAQSHLLYKKEQSIVNDVRRVSSTMKSKELLEIHEAFEMFDADGDGKVETSIKIKLRTNLFFYSKFRI